MTRQRYKGFTLAEVLVASTLSGFIAVVAVAALNAVANTAQAVGRVSEVDGEIRFAARMIAHDLANLYRDPNPENMKLLGGSQGTDSAGPPFLTFYMVGRAKARFDQPEGDVYEVEYFLGTRQEQDTGSFSRAAEGEPTVLFRRLWPNPDKERPPRGVLTPISGNIGIFYIRFYDGQEWRGEWTEEMRMLPKLIEITLGTVPPEKGDPVLEVFTVAFPRMPAVLGTNLPQEGSAEGDPRSGSQPSGGPGNPNQGNPTSQSQGNQGAQRR
ncbi:MAG TPA: type II secretion system protein GspJ [Sedimentisphaerales bacterium]|nr:prepilin-type N-terminal cleavage/methylation domain-containing protein [Phycisphaerae bacterium]HON90184.1 type II secretion system protein GspJ [Sedimentisphaerales bacterium]HQI27786.1 type II secretion system protein GspJ [Sedimentisphaerales bacterium]